MIVRSGGLTCELFQELNLFGIELSSIGVRAVERKAYEFVTDRHGDGQRIDRRILRIEMRTQFVEPYDLLLSKQHPYQEIVCVESRWCDRCLARGRDAFETCSVFRAAVERGCGELERVYGNLDEAIHDCPFIGRVWKRRRSTPELSLRQSAATEEKRLDEPPDDAIDPIEQKPNRNRG